MVVPVACSHVFWRSAGMRIARPSRERHHRAGRCRVGSPHRQLRRPMSPSAEHMLLRQHSETSVRISCPSKPAATTSTPTRSTATASTRARTSTPGSGTNTSMPRQTRHMLNRRPGPPRPSLSFAVLSRHAKAFSLRSKRPRCSFHSLSRGPSRPAARTQDSKMVR